MIEPESPHGIPPQLIERLGQRIISALGSSSLDVGAVRTRMDQFMPSLASGGGDGVVRLLTDQFGSALPPGATFAPGAGRNYVEARKNTHAKAQSRLPARSAASWGTTSYPSDGGASTFLSPQKPYQPEFESPDRQQYPVHRILANRYWRLFYKLDPVIGTCIDMYSDLPWSEYDHTGEGVEGEVKERLDTMVEVTKLHSVLPHVLREFFVVGEAVPHCFFDDTQGIWTYIALHNPDQLEVIDAPFIKMDPVIEFRPDDKLRQILTSTHPMLTQVRESMPDELITALMQRQNIPLSPLNCTFLPRRLHMYEARGTSIISRLWRILMYEDAIFNASIATARRHAGPLKIAKLGDPNTGWIPGPDHEKRLLELLAQAELDVNAWLVWHYGISFELVGTTDRIMTIDRHWDLIERVKLIALGVSKAFLHGEVTYASAASGLTVFLQRLKAIRDYVVSEWLIPKFYKVVAVINKWVKPTEAELSNKIRIRRSHQEVLDDGRYIVPTLEWRRKLDPQVDMEMVNAMTALTQNLGVTFSKRTAMAAVGRDYETELKQAVEDVKTEQRILEDMPPGASLGQAGEGGGGGMVPGVSPGLPPESFEEFGPPSEGGEALEVPPPSPGEGGEPPAASVEAEAGGTEPTPPDDPLADRDDPHRIGPERFDSRMVQDLVRVFNGDVPDEPVWERLIRESQPFRVALAGDDREEMWEAACDWLLEEGYPTSSVAALADALRQAGVLRDIEAELVAQIPRDVAHLGSDRFLTGTGRRTT